jgi:hypothetical protein
VSLNADISRFLDVAKSLRFIDRHDLVKAEVISDTDQKSWDNFQEDPIRWMMRAPDDQVTKLWSLVEASLKPAQPKSAGMAP